VETQRWASVKKLKQSIENPTRISHDVKKPQQLWWIKSVTDKEKFNCCCTGIANEFEISEIKFHERASYSKQSMQLLQGVLNN